MGDLPSGRVRVRGKRLAAAWAAWLALALFIVAGSAGTWSAYQPGIWAPTLLVPRDVARNVLLYVPFGVFGMVALHRRDPRGVVRVAGLAMLFSLGVETLQLYTIDRVASVTDIVSAGVGAVVGATLVVLLARAR